LKTILVTGGAGYIGSHACVELQEAGYDVVVVDNLHNGCEEALRRVEAITGRKLAFIRADVRDGEALRTVFEQYPIDAVIHFAGLKSVSESVREPDLYFDVNLGGSVTLSEVMAQHEVRNLVFSSTAAVYGEPSFDPIDESYPAHPIQPYGESKLAVEKHLNKLHAADNRWNAISLRYFNPVGAHASGTIGEDPLGVPDNLTPYITQVAVGKREFLQVFGSDWETEDGTGVRDYLHVVDLARAHVRAIECLARNPGALTLNLGTGRPYSVLEVLAAFERAVGKPIPYRIVGRRDGDSAIYYADPSRAASEMGWRADYDIDDMARDAWRWQQSNPNGYRET
jgi:UDP-glucose 4-epimerase